MGNFIELGAADGHRFAAYRAEPSGTPHGAVVIAPEIFGINSHIRGVADSFADEGFVAIAPALFDRVRRDFETGYSPADIETGRALMQKGGMDQAIMDVTAAVEHASAAGKVGIVGYCWGGTVAWVAAARVPGLACAVPYYGGGIANYVDARPQCPVMFHFGEQDTHPTPEQARAVAAAHPSAQAYFYPAGHGFNCDQRGSYNVQSSLLARQRTLGFLREHLAG